MLDTFDSRVLRYTDCYGQRFMRTGKFRYNVVNAAWAPVTNEYPYTLEVVAAKDDASGMQQHTVTIRLDGTQFRPDRETITLAEGDLVLWHCPDATKTPFAVVGEKDFFGNLAMVNECGFSHVFGAAGEYQWVDAYGSDVKGIVRVADPASRGAKDLQEWRRRLTEGALVMITEGRAEPAEVEIITGQTVYFAVVKEKGISVTDVRLIGMDSSKQESEAVESA